MTRSTSFRKAIALPLAALALAASSAFAATQGPADDTFYNDVFPTEGVANGTLISYRNAPIKAGALANLANGWNVIYQSKDSLDFDNIVSGTVFVPKAAWTGTGPRPVVLYAIGTQGLATRCAPSRQFAAGTEYEESTIRAALAAGYSVLVTDYAGYLKTPFPTYLAGKSQGQALLDIFKAAQAVPGAGIAANAPVGIWGYSQGGQTAAFAGELKSTYAPSINLKGVAIGGAPTDFFSASAYLDGSYGFAFLAGAIVGLSNEYGEDIPVGLIASQEGQAALNKLGTQCIFEALFDVMNDKLSQYTAGNQTLENLIKLPTVKQRLGEQTLGTKGIPVPVYLFHGQADEFIELKQGVALKKAYCDKGTNVAFDVYPSEHIATLSQAGSKVVSWLGDRFKGVAATGTCNSNKPAPVSTAIAPGGDLVVNLDKWKLDASVKLRLLGDPIVLPADTKLTAVANVTKQTLTGSISIPKFSTKANFIGLKIPTALTIEPAGPVTGSNSLDNLGILRIKGNAPVNITITSLAYIPFGVCKTEKPVDFPLNFTGPVSSLGDGTLTFAGTTTFPKITGCSIKGTLSAIFSGTGQSYSFTAIPPAPVAY